jgi:predicted transcriptional regulator
MDKKRVKAIKKWLIEKELTRVEIARELGVTPTAIWLVIEGKSKSKRIADYFKQHGCPVNFMDEKAA